ncbi:MAG: hypothetical protein L6R40_001401 [Gallowayella cf. fulva]|nr:MAG: hypothetical protein L6R40_001401 [Xanthomendoza cf. fulva]
MERLCSLHRRFLRWLSSRRLKRGHPDPETSKQEAALRKIMETHYPAYDPSADRRRYEINMLLLFRLFITKRFHHQLPEHMDDKTQESLRRLLLFTNTIPGVGKRYQESRRREGQEAFLGDLAEYWRSRPNRSEMMMYKDIWEHVAQRPLAWERLPEWHGDGRREL